MIWTSYFAKVHELEALGITCVSIARDQPDWWKQEASTNRFQCYDLAPPFSMFKMPHDLFEYKFKEDILGKLNVEQVYNSLSAFAGDIALICWEPVGQSCHRHIVANWLNNYLNSIGKPFIREYPFAGRRWTR